MTASPADLREDPRVVAALAALDRDALRALLLAMVATPSPTGEERPLAELVAGHLRERGVPAHVQQVGERGANVVARVGRAAGGPRVLLYAPLDTAFAGDPAEDDPFLGALPRADFALPPVEVDGKVVGLGAENPKGFAAAAISAVEALARAGADLAGEVVLGLAGGSMPVNRRAATGDAIVGHGTGIRALLAAEPGIDAAVLLKPGYAVGTEEVGLAWFRLTVRGAVGYTGIRHKLPDRNPIVAAARLVTALEAWFPAYTAAHGTGLVSPQGAITAIRAGSGDRAAFIPERCEIDLDLRVAPDSSPDDAERQLREAIAAIVAEQPGLEVTVERTAGTAGTRTDPGSPIARSMVRAWEAREGREHVPIGKGSGASDAPFIRGAGIPAVRIGPPAPATPSPYGGFSMGVADIDSMVRLSEVLVMGLVDAAGTLDSGATAGATDR